MQNCTLLLIAFLCSFNIAQAQSEAKLWKKIVKTSREHKTERLVKKYFIKYPDGQYKDDIENWLLGACLGNLDKDQCRLCVRFFPKGDHADEALKLLARHAPTDQNNAFDAQESTDSSNN